MRSCCGRAVVCSKCSLSAPVTSQRLFRYTCHSTEYFSVIVYTFICPLNCTVCTMLLKCISFPFILLYFSPSFLYSLPSPSSFLSSLILSPSLLTGWRDAGIISPPQPSLHSSGAQHTPHTEKPLRYGH